MVTEELDDGWVTIDTICSDSKAVEGPPTIVIPPGQEAAERYLDELVELIVGVRLTAKQTKNVSKTFCLKM